MQRRALDAANLSDTETYPNPPTDWGRAWRGAATAETLFALAEAAGLAPQATARAALAVAAHVRRFVEPGEPRPAEAYAAAMAMLEGRGDVAALEAAILACDGATLGADVSTVASAAMGEAVRAVVGVEGSGRRAAKFAARASLMQIGFDRKAQARAEERRADLVRVALPLAVVLTAATEPGRLDGAVPSGPRAVRDSGPLVTPSPGPIPFDARRA